MPKDHMRQYHPNQAGARSPAAVDLNFKQRACKANLNPVDEDSDQGERDYMEDLFWLRHDLGFDPKTYWNR